MRSKNLQSWMDYFEGEHHDATTLEPLLADDVTFLSPIVHTPQEGKAITMAYLTAAGKTIGGENFKYVREFDCGDRAVLEFTNEIDGIQVNGIDMFEWNDEGKITEIKVMIRPLKAIQLVHGAMAKMLESMKAQA